MAARLLSCGGSPAATWMARRRSRWMSSATLASNAKWREGADDGNGLMDVDAVEHGRPARHDRSRSAAPGTTPPVRAFDEVEHGRRRSVHERCRRGSHRAAGCPHASVRCASRPTCACARHRSARAQFWSPSHAPSIDGRAGPQNEQIDSNESLYLICRATPTIDTSQIPATSSVSPSRFFSTTVDPPGWTATPPPNRWTGRRPRRGAAARATPSAGW